MFLWVLLRNVRLHCDQKQSGNFAGSGLEPRAGMVDFLLQPHLMAVRKINFLPRNKARLRLEIR